MPLPIAAVIPVLNCCPDLPAHLESIAPWLDSIEEVIVVDSFSEDGSLEFLTRHLRTGGFKPPLRIMALSKRHSE